MRPILHVVNPQGNPVNIQNPLPPVRGLEVKAVVDSVIKANFPHAFKYEIAKGVFGLQRGMMFTEVACKDGRLRFEDVNSRPGNIASFEVKEMYRIDTQGNRELVKPHNPVIRFVLR